MTKNPAQFIFAQEPCSEDAVKGNCKGPCSLGDLKKIYELSKKHDVKVVYFNSGLKVKFRKEYFDLEGRQNIKKSFLKCYKCCHQLRDGRLYMCPAVAYIKYMNRFFSTNFEVTPADYIDIYQINGIKELLNYLNKPIPFCRYCDMGKNDLINWQISKKEISEWT